MGVKKGKEYLGIDRKKPSNTLEDLRGKVAGIDASIWLMEIIKASYQLQVKFHMSPPMDFDFELHLKLSERLKVLTRFGIKPVFVFDGFRSPCKSEETTRRQHHQNIALKKLKDALLRSDISNCDNLKSLYRDATYINEDVTASTLLWCQKNGIQTVQAPLEADSQLYRLCTDNIIDFIMTEDTDHVYSNSPCVVLDTNWKSCVESCDSELEVTCNIVTNIDIKEKLGKKWNLSFPCASIDLVIVANLMGTDYYSVPGIGPQKVDSVMQHYYSLSDSHEAYKDVDYDKLVEAIQKFTKFKTDDVPKLKIGINCFLYSLCFRILPVQTSTDSRTAFFSNNIQVDLTTMNTAPLTGNKLLTSITRRMNTYKDVSTSCEHFLGFNLSDANIFCGFDWSNKSQWIRVFKAEIYGKTGKAISKIKYSKEEPKGSVIDFSKIHINNITKEILLTWLHHRRMVISPNSTIDQVRKVAQKIKDNLDKYPIVPKEIEVPQEYLALESLIMGYEGPALVWVKKPDDIVYVIRSLLSDNGICLIDDAYILNIFGKRPSNRIRAHRKVVSGHHNMSTLKLCKCLARVGNKQVKCILFNCHCTPSYRGSVNKDNYYIHLLFEEATGAFISEPFSRCSCVDGRYFCSHMLGLVEILYIIHTVGSKFTTLMPEPVLSFKNECISLNYFVENIYMKPSIDKKVFSYLENLNDDIGTDDDSDTDSVSSSENDDSFNDKASSIVKDTRKKESLPSIIQMANDFIKKSMVLVSTGDESETKIELRAKTSISDIKKNSALQLRRGPNANRKSKIVAYEIFERLHNGYSNDKIMPICLLSHYLDSTVKEREEVLRQLKDPEVEFVEVDIGTAQIPPGMPVAGDRGMAGDSIRYKNFNLVITPSFLEGEQQFTTAEIFNDMKLCRDRYSSEAIFSRATDLKILQGIIPVIEFPVIESAIAWGHAKNNIGLPYYDPQNWNDYVVKVRGEEYLDYLTVKKEKHRVFTMEMHELYKSLDTSSTNNSKKRKST